MHTLQRWALRSRDSIAARLLGIAALAISATLALTIVSLDFADRTRAAAADLQRDGGQSAALATQLELWLEQQRLLMLTMSGLREPGQFAAARWTLDAIDVQLAAAGLQLQRAGSAETRELGSALDDALPRLSAESRAVLEQAQADPARAVAEANVFADMSGAAASRIASWRGQREATRQGAAAALTEAAPRMMARVLGCAGLALLLYCAAGLMCRRVLAQLDEARRAMPGVARGDPAAHVPPLSRRDGLGSINRAIDRFRDHTLRLTAQEAALTDARQRLEVALSNMSQGLCQYDGEHRLQVWNGRFAELFNLDPGQLRAGMPLADVLRLSIAAGNYASDSFDQVYQASIAGENAAGGSRLVLLGGQRYICISRRAIDDGGWVSTYEDVTARHVAERQVSFLARHDALTGLANRVVLRERLEAVAGAPGQEAALLLLDLDRFKAVNDTLGHPIGDALLRAVSGRLVGLVREGDVAARLGGDEFALLVGVVQPDDARGLADRVIEAMADPFELEGHQVVTGASVGVAMIPADGATAEELLRNADLALYHAKGDGKGRSCFFEPAMDARLQQRRSLERDLRAALARDEFELHYQPLVDLDRGEASGFEALLRWRHPERGLVPPADFISVLEDIGLIGAVGDWVIRRACVDAEAWPDELTVAVNLSPIQFLSAGLPDAVARAVTESGLAPARLELEITESVLLQDNETTLRTLHALRDLGVRIAMDDFGTGYSSLSYLRSFPFDKVKIDQSFVRDLGSRGGSIHVVRAVTGLCNGLGMGATAEGVETREQLSMLQDEGCTQVQGFLFSRPRPAAEVPATIASVREIAQEASMSKYAAMLKAPALRIVSG